MRLAQVQDQELVRNYINGHEESLSELVTRHQKKVFTYIRMLVKDTELAEDLFQDVFVKVIHTLKSGNYNEEGKFLPWAMRIAHNLVIDHFRKSNKVRLISESSSTKDDFNIFSTLSLEDKNIQETMSYDELEKQMVDLIDHLPATQRDILKMRIFRDMSFKDIAEAEDISINTALGRMRYALINMRKLIEKHQLVTDI